MSGYTCTNCGEEVDETEFIQYKENLSSVEEDMFDDSGLCPSCFESVK